MYRKDFPVFDKQPELVYLDSAATTQKPKVVIEAVKSLYESGIANPDRGLYPIGLASTAHLLASRQTVARFLSAKSEEIVFTHNATESLAMLAHGLGNQVQPGDEIVISDLEHHSNILPWRQLAEEKKLTIRQLPFDRKTGKIQIGELSKMLNPRTKIVSLSLVSNVFGSLSELDQVRKILDQQGREIIFVIDACQAAPHHPLSPSKLGADFLAFSGHKCYGPGGVGVLWGKTERLARLLPLKPGGGTVEGVKRDRIVWKPDPERLEGGTANLEGIVGFAAALEYLMKIGMDKVWQHTQTLVDHAKTELQTVPGLELVIDPQIPTSLISFTMEKIHPHDLAEGLGQQNICIRAGQHCAGPLFEQLGLPATARASFGLYNTDADTHKLVAALKQLSAHYNA